MKVYKAWLLASVVDESEPSPDLFTTSLGEAEAWGRKELLEIIAAEVADAAKDEREAKVSDGDYVEVTEYELVDSSPLQLAIRCLNHQYFAKRHRRVMRLEIKGGRVTKDAAKEPWK